MIVSPLISVIVPVYNTQKYVVKCINSILMQRISEIEIIIVNDCSTDNSLELIKKLAAQDSRIVIIDKIINQGVELARKSGLDLASGVFVTYVDSDDWLVQDSLEKLYKEAVLNNSDVTVGKMVRVLDKFGLIKRGSNLDVFRENILLTHKEFMEKYYQGFFGVNNIPVNMCGCLYKKRFIDRLEIKPLNFNMGEDLNYNIQVFPEAERISFISDCVYYYRFGGMTSKFNEKIIDAALKMYDLKKDMIEKYDYAHIGMYTIFELKNYLRSYIEMLIRFKPYPLDESYLRVSEIISDVRYEEVITFYKKLDKQQEDFVIALLNKDIHLLFQIAEKRHNKKRVNLLVKQIISKILN